MLDLYFGEMSRWTDGLILTTVMSTLSVVIGFFVALPIALARSRSKGITGWLALGYVNIFRGVPLHPAPWYVVVMVMVRGSTRRQV